MRKTVHKPAGSVHWYEIKNITNSIKPMKTIDLRSDTVTKPCLAMRSVMSKAVVGDDVYEEDPTINRLESFTAEIVGTEAALFVPSGTQSNLLALLTHCQRGDEYIAGQQAHTYKYEGGGAAVLGSIQPQPIDFEQNGTLDLHKVHQAIKPDDVHFARTRLLCLENTQDGKALPLDYIKDASEFTQQHQLNLHLDGARIFNAAVKLSIPVEKITSYFDSISLCLSKGLGAPVGSLLCASKEQISEARRWRKVLGGGMRQAGILASAGIYALENNINRLSEDHSNASLLAEGLSEIEELQVTTDSLQTNMVFVTIDTAIAHKLQEHLKEKGILIYGGPCVRLVTHLDVDKKDICRVIEAFKYFYHLLCSNHIG